MTLEEYYVELFKFATGWLGYTPDVALDATISHLVLAREGKFDFLRKTNPWRTQKDIDEENLGTPIGAENVARKALSWAMAMAGYKPPKRGNRQKEGVVLPPGMEMPEIPTTKKG